MKTIRKLLAAALVMAMVCGAQGASAEGSKGILYQVKGRQGTMYLLGSIHVGNSEMYPFGEAIRQAMEACDTFVYECDTTSNSALREAQSRMFFAGDDTLSAAIPQPLYDQFATVCEKIGLNAQNFETVKPWAVINTLAIYATAAEMGVNDVNEALSLGVEKQVQAYAAQNGKQTAYLETLTEQLDALEGFSPALTQYLLAGECDVILNPENAHGMDASIAQWPEWWANGDAEAFSEQYLSSYLETGFEDVCAEYHDTLVTRRNQLMADRLETMLTQGGNYFVTVGLLHVALENDSILTHLQKKGYTVERLTRP